MLASRREVLRLGTAGVATAALSATGFARAQVTEEADNEPVTLIRKGIG
jgi:L-lactate oxidase